MANLPFKPGTWKRKVAREAELETKNRYYETNPVLNNEGAGLLARPGVRYYQTVGEGPIRGLFSSPGSFDESLFVVSGKELYRVETDDAVTLIESNAAAEGGTPVKMAVTGRVGVLGEILYLASGGQLLAYMSTGYSGSTFSGTPTDGDTVQIGSQYYRFTSGGVDSGTPDGTSGNPWLVALSVTPLSAWDNLKLATNADGVPGTEYSTALTEANPDAGGYSNTGGSLLVFARAIGAAGNGVNTVVISGTLTVDTGSTVGGGLPRVVWIPLPENAGAISVAVVSSYVVIIPTQVGEMMGRFYWLEPGEIYVDPLNFATAERSTDPISEVVVFGDNFWLPGSSTTEAWFFTGSPDVPIQRQQGVVYDWGTLPGTAVQIKSSMVIVDSMGAVFLVSGGIQRISNPSLEERIREADREAG